MTKDIDVFNKVKRHLLTQGSKSYYNHLLCGYRGYSPLDFYKTWEEIYGEECPMFFEDTNPFDMYDDSDESESLIKMVGAVINDVPKTMACAVGCLISDEYYSPNFEGDPMDDEHVMAAIRLSIPDWDINDHSIAMLKELQLMHDTEDFDKWEDVMNNLKFDQDGNYIS